MPSPPLGRLSPTEESAVHNVHDLYYQEMGKCIMDDIYRDTANLRFTLGKYHAEMQRHLEVKLGIDAHDPVRTRAAVHGLELDMSTPPTSGNLLSRAYFLGCALELLALSPYHAQFRPRYYFGSEVLPPVEYQQVRVYLNENNLPIGITTWAWVSAKVETELHRTGRSLNFLEWRSGCRLFFNDWISRAGHREIMRDMTSNVFPHMVATSLRRHPDGTVRRINRWTGDHWRRARGTRTEINGVPVTIETPGKG